MLTVEHRSFLTMLRVIDEQIPALMTHHKIRGRKPYEDKPILFALLAKSFFRIDTVADVRKRLQCDPNLRKICGFHDIPSEATFSRRLSQFANQELSSRIMNDLVKKYLAGRIIGHITRDSTAIEGREKPCNKRREVRQSTIPEKKRRGRPRRGESRPEKKLTRVARQIRLKSGRAIAELDKQAAWGCKKNSQGNVTFWKGYKLHLDITDQGIPVTALVTGANVHDSQAAIPMEKITEKRVTHLYSLMDAAYDAEPIRQYIEGKGRKAIIDMNKRKNDSRSPFDPATKERFKIRSTSERGNAHLKDWLLPSKIMVRGARKVSFHLLTGVLCLSAIKILQVIILPQMKKQAEAA